MFIVTIKWALDQPPIKLRRSENNKKLDLCTLQPSVNMCLCISKHGGFHTFHHKNYVNYSIPYSVLAQVMLLARCKGRRTDTNIIHIIKILAITIFNSMKTKKITMKILI